LQIRRRRKGGNAEIVLHHRAGAADLVTDQRPEIGRQQRMKRILNAVSAGFVLRRDIGGERPQKRAIAAVGGNGFCSREDIGHEGLPHPEQARQRRLEGWAARTACFMVRDARAPLLAMRDAKTSLFVAIDLLALLVPLLRLHR
jgi:hypothetical protein